MCEEMINWFNSLVFSFLLDYNIFCIVNSISLCWVQEIQNVVIASIEKFRFVSLLILFCCFRFLFINKCSNLMQFSSGMKFYSNHNRNYDQYQRNHKGWTQCNSNIFLSCKICHLLSKNFPIIYTNNLVGTKNKTLSGKLFTWMFLNSQHKFFFK